jgi:hypothetical protein
VKRARREPPRLAPGDERRVEALTVAMALAPGVYARNRMFDFFAQAAVQRARSRAAILRGIVPQLARAKTLSISNEGPHTTTGEASFVLRYRIAELRMSRVVELSPTELAALRLLASRANARLIVLGDETSALARAARDSATPPAIE